jgi:uncharacterized protein (TIGR00299 family) protein
MTFAYFDCFAGVAGDMVLGALLDAGGSLERLRAGLAALDRDVGPIELAVTTTERGGIGATHVEVAAPGPPRVRDWAGLRAVLEGADLPEAVRARALAVFTRLAEAEGRVHRVAPERVHFHEVGAADAVADVVGAALLLDDLGVAEAWASPVAVGSGGTTSTGLPLPAPAVVELLRGVPIYGGGVAAELATPTGAAILTSIATRFGALPPLEVAAVGYGAGGRRLRELPNLLRVLLGRRVQEEAASMAGGADGAGAVVLETNIDDMTPELAPWVLERLLEAGAADAWITPVHMKKGRPGIVLSVLCQPGQEATLREVVWRETSTLGMRGMLVRKWRLERRAVTVELPGLGPGGEAGTPARVRVKLGLDGDRVINVAPEYADCARVATASGQPLKEVMARAQAAALALLDREAPA